MKGHDQAAAARGLRCSPAAACAAQQRAEWGYRPAAAAAAAAAPQEQEKKSRVKGLDAVKANIQAAKAVSRVLRTSLGPKGMDKLLQGPDGDIMISERGIWGAARAGRAGSSGRARVG